jgi:hypothetical protein
MSVDGSLLRVFADRQPVGRSVSGAGRREHECQATNLNARPDEFDDRDNVVFVKFERLDGEFAMR